MSNQLPAQVDGRLESLAKLKEHNASVRALIKQALRASERISHVESVVAQAAEEKQLLELEALSVRTMLSEAREDLLQLEQAEESLAAKQKSLGNEFEMMRTTEFDPLKEQVDAYRQREGIARTANLQEDIDRHMADYLKSRMENWRNDASAANVTAQDGISLVSSPSALSSSRPGSREGSLPAPARGEAPTGKRRGRPPKSASLA